MSEPVVGIDLGTSTSAVAAVVDGKPRVILNRGGQPLTHSMVGFTDKGQRVIGEGALMLADEHPERVAVATKRFIGRRFTPELEAEAKRAVAYPIVAGPQGEVRVAIDGREMPVTQIGAMLLGELKLDAQSFFGKPVRRAVITVPANFDDLQRQATREAAQIAGLEVMRLVNEPTAAAVAYGLTASFRGKALVFDLGGGTFDVSIIEAEEGVFQVRSTGGDPFLGGEDFDARIADWLLAQIPDPYRDLAAKDPLSLRRLKVAAQRAKHELTGSEEAYISIPQVGDHATGKLMDLDTALTRTFFETLSEPLSRRCLEVCGRVLSESGLQKNQLEAVLLVGGMTRVPLVRKLVKDFFGIEPATGVNPDEAVALGAAIHASELAGSSQAALLLDVASHSLGVGIVGGKVRRLLEKNTALPTTAKEVFLPSSANKRARISVFQGESDYQDENVKLGEVVLTGLSGTHRSEMPIEVVFELSTEGTLAVRATDMTTGRMEAVKVEARTELSADEVAALAKEQAEYAQIAGTQLATDRFKRLLERTEKLMRLLEQGARENPTASAQELVANVKALLDSGRAALHRSDAGQIQELAPKLTALVTQPRA
jgi:molecular chaperone DnaK